MKILIIDNINMIAIKPQSLYHWEQSLYCRLSLLVKGWTFFIVYNPKPQYLCMERNV